MSLLLVLSGLAFAGGLAVLIAASITGAVLPRYQDEAKFLVRASLWFIGIGSVIFLGSLAFSALAPEEFRKHMIEWPN